MADIKDRINNQPEYKIGQEVIVTVNTKDEKTELEFSNKVSAHISEIRAAGTSEKDTYEYGVTLSMPGCYFTGKKPFKFIEERAIKIANEIKE